MNIAIISPYAEPEKGAATIRVNAFCEFFEKKGVYVKVFAPKRKGVRKVKGVKRYSGLIDLMNIIRLGSFELVIGTSPPLTHNFFALVAAHFSGKKFVLDAKEDRYVFEEKPSILSIAGLKRRLYFLLRRLTYKNSDLLFFLTDWDKNEAKSSYGVSDEKLVLLSNGTVSKTLKYSESKAKAVRKKLGIPFSAPLLVYAGSIGDEEIDLFVKAFDSIAGNVYLLLVIAIEKSNEPELKAILKSSNSRDRILVEQNVPYSKMSGFLSAGDIGIVPWTSCYFTSIPVKVFDYLSCGLPLLIKGPGRGALSDFYSKNEFVGFYSTNWSDFSIELKKALKRIPALKKERAKRRKFVEGNFDRQKVLEKVFGKRKDFFGL